MGLFKNIAGFDSQDYTGEIEYIPQVTAGYLSAVGATAPPTSPTGAGPALLQNLVKLANPQAAAAANPVVLAVEMGINLLPAGGLKDWLSKNPISFWKSIWTLITGTKYRSGEYRLGERVIDQVDPTTPVNSVTSYRQIPDDLVPKAKLLLTVLFGVRIDDQGDLDALQQGPDAYAARPLSGDIPRAAIERASMLKQTYFPDSTYNVSKWNLDYFSKYPLVAPIPDPFTVGKLYTGPLPGGGQATNGVILIDAATPLSSVQTGTQTGATQDKTKMILLIVGGGLLLWAGYEYYKKKTPKK